MDSRIGIRRFFQEFPLFVELDPVIFPVKTYAELRLQTLDWTGTMPAGRYADLLAAFVRFSYRAAAKKYRNCWISISFPLFLSRLNDHVNFVLIFCSFIAFSDYYNIHVITA